MKNENRLEILC